MTLRLTHTRLFAAILLILTFSHCALATDATLSGTIRDPFGNAFNGQIMMTLSQPAVDPTGVVDYVPTQVPFSVLNGTLQAGAKLVSNDSLQPQNTYYLAQYFDPTGAMVQQKVFYFLAGANNLGSMVPTNITTNNVSYLSPVSLSANNTFTGTNTFTKQVVITQNAALPPLSVGTNQTVVPNLGASHITSDNPFAVGLPPSTSPVSLAPDDKICWENHLHSGYVCLGTVSVAPAQDQFQWTGSTGPTTHILPYSHSFPMNNAAINNSFNLSAAEQSLISGGFSLGTIPANDMTVGSFYRIYASGNLTNNSGINTTDTFRIRLDAVAGPVYCATAGVVVATGANSVPWNIECIIAVNTVGGAGFNWADGRYTVNATSGAITNAALISVDTTVSHAVYITGQMTAVNVTAILAIHTAYMEKLTAQ